MGPGSAPLGRSAAWSAAASPTASDLWAVEMVSRYEAWAVGDHGVILHWVDPNRPGMTVRAYVPLMLR